MTMAATIAPTAPEAPTEEAAVAALAVHVGKALAKELWMLALTDLNLSHPVRDPFQLRRVAERLMTIGDGCRVGGRGLRVQVITHQALIGS
jgi:hypothetical protein